MSRLVTDWTDTPSRFLDQNDISRLFMQLLGELGYAVEYRQTEEDSGPRTSTYTEYRLKKVDP